MNAIDQRRKAQPQPTPTPQPTGYISILTPGQYRELESKVLIGVVRADTSPVQSGFFNGVEHVLRKLREGFVSQ